MNSDEIKVLRPGETGYGMMIEHDAGHISPSDSRNDGFINEVNKLTEGGKIDKEPLILYVVLQKYGVENKNGRIYPKDVLEREVNNYQENVNAGNAVGECVPAGTEIYTSKNGWRPIEEVKEGEEILTLNPNNNQLENQKIQRTTKKWYNDQMVHIWNNSKLDMMVTKNHKKVLWDRNGKPYIITAEELYNKIKNGDTTISKSHIKNSGNWEGNNPKYVHIGGHKIKSETWAKFLGLFISEGHTNGTKGGSEIANEVCITQKNLNKQALIEEVLDELPYEYYFHNKKQYKIYNKELHNELKKLGNSYEKYIPDYAKNWSVELLNILIEYLLMGDGWNRKNKKGELMREYYTTSDKLTDDVFEIMMKSGNGASIYQREQKDRYIEGRKILEENSKNINVIHERTAKGIYLDKRYTNAELVDFNDYVYCVTVPNGTWLMRYNGKVCWTHNSDHPDSSIVTINNISHRIIDTWWDNKTLMGKMEIILTPAFMNYGQVFTAGDQIANLLRVGVKIGVSSRGVGSLKEIQGKKMVQDDFELICWDAVISPSTPGSWADFNEEDLQPYMESTIKKPKKESINRSLDNFLLD